MKTLDQQGSGAGIAVYTGSVARIFRHYVAHEILLLILADGLFVLLSFVGVSSISPLMSKAPGVAPVGTKALLVMTLIITTLNVSGLYDHSERYGRRELGLRVVLALTAAYLLIATIGYLIQPLALGRRVYTASFLLSFGAILAIRLAHQRLVRASLPRRRMLVVGSGEPARIVAEAVRSTRPRYEIIGCVDGNVARIGGEVDGMTVLGSVDELGRVSQACHPDVIVVALKERRQSLPVPAILDCKFQGIEVEDWPNFYEKLTGKIFVQNLRPSWLIFSDGFKINNVTLATKRAVDFGLSLVGLALSLPLFPLIAALIRIDSPGPIFYGQERLGYRGKRFWLLKFRSMRHDAELQTGPAWAREDDPRMTRVGRVLRRTRFDELPQLINVLRGEMSLVGPRPERPPFVVELQEKIPFYMNRLAVKPGITGWAQVNYPYGASTADALEKLQYDLYYIKNVSIFLDLLILLHTVQVILFGRGAR